MASRATCYRVFSRLLTCLCLPSLVSGTASMATATEIEKDYEPSAAFPAPSGKPEIQVGYGNLPMRFEPNLGLSADGVKFTARGPGYQLFLTPAEAVLVLRQGGAVPVAGGQAMASTAQDFGLPGEAGDASSANRQAPSVLGAEDTASAGYSQAGVGTPLEMLSDHPQSRSGRLTGQTDTPPASVVRIRLAGAASNATPVVEGLEKLPGHSNFFIGKDPARWHSRVPNYGKVKYHQVYPNIDLIYYGNPQQLEYDFVLAPGADPGVIQLAFEGAEQVRVAENGDLILGIAGGELVQRAPRLYQEIDGERHPVAGRYVLRQEGREEIAFEPAGEEGPVLVGFQVAHYQSDQPLVIDPVLSYGTYLGGTNSDSGSIAVDDTGNAYVTGDTYSYDFPASADAPFPTNQGGADAFVAKFNATGTALVYATYLGGGSYDYGNSIAVDGNGNAYVTGDTNSNDFPTSANAPYPVFGGDRDAFVAKLNPEGTLLEYSSYLGGVSYDYGYGIAVDTDSNAYITGWTYSNNFPVTEGAADTTLGYYDAFVAKFNASGTALVYATYVGGGNNDYGRAIALDGDGNAYVTGNTYWGDFPTSADAAYPTTQGESDAFVAKLNASGTALDYATYLGGRFDDYGYGIAVDGLGNAYVTGVTASDNFPTPNATYSVGGGGNDAFVAKLNEQGTALDYATYLGGNGNDAGHGIAVDDNGIAYVTGITGSTLFPTRQGLYTELRGGTDAFVTAFHPLGLGLIYSTYLGGDSDDSGSGIALDAQGSAYVTGQTQSSNFPTTPGAFAAGPADAAFVGKIALGGNLLLVSGTGAGQGMVSSTLPNADISCGNECAAIYPPATAVRLVAAANGLSIFSGWGGNCVAAGGNTTCNLSMAGNRAVSAGFNPRTDNEALGLVLDLNGAVWNGAGDAPWFAQERVTHDGVDAAQSGAIGDNQISELETTLTGPGYLSFWWKVSSEAGWDYLTLYLDDVALMAITGEGEWAWVRYFVPPGAHVLTWSYEKDASDADGEDAGWVDQVAFHTANFTLGIDAPSGGSITGATPGTYPPGTQVNLEATAAAGFYFSGWGGDCIPSGQAATCALTLDRDLRVSANFVPYLQGAATAVAAGQSYACAIADGGVRCWGTNDAGQLGNGTTTRSLIPVQAIAAGSGATAIAAGSDHTCAVVAGGVKCWGSNGSGQLGNGTTTQSLIPVQSIAAGSGATVIAAGHYHTCALVAGAVQCWGSNGSGQFGNSTTAGSLIPLQTISSEKGVSAIAFGDIGYYFDNLWNSHACALVVGGVKCWGKNGNGELGNGTTTPSLFPVKAIAEGSDATASAAGGGHSCALVAGGVQCWGGNWYGQLGDGTSNQSSLPVTAIVAASNAIAIAAGPGHTCAVMAGGVTCWGENGDGQLGDGTTTSSLVPIQTLAAGSAATGIAASKSRAYGMNNSYSCAVVAGGVKCWGSNWSGQLGDGSTNNALSPVAVVGLGPAPSSECAYEDQVEIANTEVTGNTNLLACRVITTGPGVVVVSGGNLSMSAGERVVLKPGVRVEAGAVLSARIEPSLKP